MVSRALAAAVHLACAFGLALCWAANLDGLSQESLPTRRPHSRVARGGSHAGAATVPLLLVSTSYFLTVTLIYLELAVVASPGLIAARRLAAATANVAAVTSLLALSAAVYGALRPNGI